MGRPEQRTDRDGLENYAHELNVSSTNALLAAIILHHSAPAVVPEPASKPDLPRKPWFEIIDEIPGDFTSPPRVEDIKRLVCKYFEVSLNDLTSQRRTLQLTRPRQIAMYLSKELTGKSLPELGRRFGGRDHTTVLHSVRKVRDSLCTDWLLAHDVAYLEAALS